MQIQDIGLVGLYNNLPIQTRISNNHKLFKGSKGGGGGAQNHWINFVFSIQLFISILKDKAQIARESIKITRELPGPLSGPWTPAESEFGSALVMCMLAIELLVYNSMMLAHHFLRPPPPPKWKSWIRPCKSLTK